MQRISYAKFKMSPFHEKKQELVTNKKVFTDKQKVYTNKYKTHGRFTQRNLKKIHKILRQSYSNF